MDLQHEFLNHIIRLHKDIVLSRGTVVSRAPSYAQRRDRAVLLIRETSHRQTSIIGFL